MRVVGLLIVALALALRAYGIDWGLPEVYEEGTPLKKAWDMWGWGPAAHFDPNPHFFNYPSLTIYLQLLGQGVLYIAARLLGWVESGVDFAVLYVVDQTPFYLVGRSITALFGVATVWVTYRMGRLIAGRFAALLATFLLAIHVFHIERSQAVEVDVPLAFFSTLALLLTLRLLESPTRRIYGLIGLVIGLAVSTKYTGAMLVIPLFVAHVLGRKRERSHRLKFDRETARPSEWFLGFAIVMAAVGFLATSPYVALDGSTFWRHLSMEREHMRLGHFGGDALPTWRYYAQSLTDRLLGWPLTLSALAGLVLLAGIRRQRWALVLATFVVPYVIAVLSWEMKADRYLLPILPLVMLLGAAALAEILRLARLERVPRVARLGITTLAVAVLGAPVLLAFPEHLERFEPDARTLAREWIETNTPAGSFIAFEAYGPHLLGPQELARLEPAIRKKILERNDAFYALIPIQMFQVAPERSEVFYDVRLYADADLIITTSAVRNRYLADPRRFQRQVGFYDSLETRWEKAQEFAARGRSPTVTIYRNPRHDPPFAARGRVHGPAALAYGDPKQAGHVEDLFYSQLGLDYEAFRFYEAAVAAYRLGLGYPIGNPSVFTQLVFGAARCLVELGRVDEAAKGLEAGEAGAPTPEIAAQIGRARAALLARLRGAGQ